MQPTNYSGMLEQLDVSPLLAGLQIRGQNRDRKADNARQDQAVQLAQRKFEVDQQKDADYLASVEAYRNNPTPAALRDLGIRYPEKAKALMDAGDSYSAGQKRDLIGAGFSALGALATNNPTLAISTLETRIVSLKGSGVDTSHTQAAVDMVKAGKIKEATAYLSYAMGGLVGTNEAAGILETLGVGGKAEDRRADNERADAKIKLDERRIENSERATSAAIARGDERLEMARRREANRSPREVLKGSGGGKAGRRVAFSDAQLDALIQ